MKKIICGHCGKEAPFTQQVDGMNLCPYCVGYLKKSGHLPKKVDKNKKI